MPYRKAWLYLVALLALTFVAFWPTYLSNLPSAKVAHHVHASGAVLWTVFAAYQAWSVHHRRLALHRTVGLALFLLFPYFLVGGMHVIHVETTTLSKGGDAAEMLQIAQFGFFDPLANIGYATMVFLGLKHRHKVHLHARYMLGSVMFVVAPIIWRLLQRWVPIFRNDTPETIHQFSYAMAAGNVGAIAIALWLYRRAPQYGRPWLIVAGFVAAQELLFETLGRVPGWAPVFASISAINLPFLLVMTAIVSLGIAWLGWVAGARPKLPIAVAA